MLKNRKIISALLSVFILAGCTSAKPVENPKVQSNEYKTSEKTAQADDKTEKSTKAEIVKASIGIDSIPDYNGDAWIYINDNKPYFTDDEMTPTTFESYSELDDLGRVGTAYACLGPETQPKNGEGRGSISKVYPTGWLYNGKNNNNKYDENVVEGKFIYNRCHLIMWALSAENANEKNLITGTRYLNIAGMLEWEKQANNYVSNTGNHIMYRVTPMYNGSNIVANGVLIECKSVEDNSVEFCVYCYNVQPGVYINYATGENHLESEEPSEKEKVVEEGQDSEAYILNTGNKKIHKKDCVWAQKISAANYVEIDASGVDGKLNDRYSYCKVCFK